MKKQKQFKPAPSSDEVWAMIEESRKERQEFRLEMKKLEKYLGGIANNNGKMAEEYFYNLFSKDKVFVNQTFDFIKPNFHCSDDEDDEFPDMPNAELDIFLFNGTSAAIIEVKYSARHDNVNAEKLISRIGLVKRLYPEYANHTFYLGVAAMSFDKNLAKDLHRLGIVTIHHTGKRLVKWDKLAKAF